MLTVCITSYNTLPFLKLAVSSLRRHCKQWVKLWIWDNGSTDGSAEWAMGNSDAFFTGDNQVHGHWGAMDKMGAEAQTDFVAFVDSDVEFLGDPFSAAIHHMLLRPSVFACDGGFYDIAGKQFTLPWNGKKVVQMPRIDPCCVVLDTQMLRSLQASGSTWKHSEDGESWYDVGGTLLRDALARGWTADSHPSIRDNIHHFGNSTWPANGCSEADVLDRVGRNRAIVEEKLKAYQC